MHDFIPKSDPLPSTHDFQQACLGAEFSANSNVNALLIDVNAVAKMLGISPRTVWRLAEVGRLPKPIHLGRAARWPVIDIREFVEALRDAGAAPRGDHALAQSKTQLGAEKKA